MTIAEDLRDPGLPLYASQRCQIVVQGTGTMALRTGMWWALILLAALGAGGVSAAEKMNKTRGSAERIQQGG